MKAFIGLGSNLGEREAMVRQALEEITRLPGTQLMRASSLYDTEPVGEVDQPNFLNAVAQIDTELTARQLLWNLLLIEKRLGRVRTQRYGPRTIDLDLLLYGNLIVEEHERGATILFSKHVMPQAEDICDHVVMIHKGRKVLDDPVAEIGGRHDVRTIVVEPFDSQTDTSALSRIAGIESQRARGGVIELQLREGSDAAAVMAGNE